MKFRNITFEKLEFELKKSSPKELLLDINEYFIKAPTRSNVYDKEYASGEVDFEKQTFEVLPISTDFWKRPYGITAYGIVTKEQIEIHLQTSMFSFISSILFPILFFSLFLTEAWIPIAWITVPVFTLFFLAGSLVSRKRYKRDRQNHIDFINRINVR